MIAAIAAALLELVCELSLTLGEKSFINSVQMRSLSKKHISGF